MKCSGCGKDNHDVRVLVVLNVEGDCALCDECVDLVYDIKNEKLEEDEQKE